jgi:hypothetical protein
MRVRRAVIQKAKCFIEEGAKVVFSGRVSEKGKALEEELSLMLRFTGRTQCRQP